MQARTNRDHMGKYILLTMLFAIGSTLASFGIYSQVASEQEFLETTVTERSDLLVQNIREHAFRLQMELFELNKLLEGTNPGVQGFIESKVKEYDAHAARLETQKQEAGKVREDLLLQLDASRRHQKNLRNAVLWMQCGIFIASVATLARKRLLWFMSFTVGFIGVAYFARGYWLWS